MWKKFQLNNIKKNRITNMWEKVSEDKTKFNHHQILRHQKTEETYLMGSDS